MLMKVSDYFKIIFLSLFIDLIISSLLGLDFLSIIISLYTYVILRILKEKQLKHDAYINVKHYSDAIDRVNKEKNNK